jgi:hypothetical protein
MAPQRAPQRANSCQTAMAGLFRRMRFIRRAALNRLVGRVTGYSEIIPPKCGSVRFGDHPGGISFCLNLELHAKITK